ncbi:MAG TPA: hypothetical protein VIO11_02260 [Candidatus Methanoperedens sp.]
MYLEIFAFLIGLVYAFVRPGKENRSRLFRDGVIIGIILALILVGLGVLTGGAVLLVGTIVGIYILIEIVILTILFIIGTYIGDWLELKGKSKPS